MKKVWKSTLLLLAYIGAINWGLTELGFNAVEQLLGFISWLPALIYYVVAIGGLYGVMKLAKVTK